MDQRTESRVPDWEARHFPGGYGPLHELADADFSGAVVTNGGTWLFLLNGRAVGVFEGRIEDFESEEGTVYKAPDPSLPLLFAMLEIGGEQQAKYYTNDTPISEAHQQLSEAQFTGFIELSENVVSGDYYVVYYGGRSMSCAFVGSGERLLTGDEAFQQADDEVGIYEVRTVDVEVVDIPEPGGAADAEPDPAGGATEPGAGDTEQATSDTQPPGGTEPADPGAGGQEPVTPSGGDDAAAGEERDSTQPTGSEPTPGDGTAAGTGGTQAGGAAGADGDEQAAEGPTGQPVDEPGGPQGDQQPDPEQGERTRPADGEPDTGEPAAGGERPETTADAEAGSSGEGRRTGSAAEPATGSAGGDGRSTSGPGGSELADSGQGRASGASGTSAATPTVEPQPKAAFDETTAIPSLSPSMTGPDADVEPAQSGGTAVGSADDGAVGSRSAVDAGASGSGGRRSPEEVTGGAVRSTGTTESGDVDVVDAAVPDDADPGELRAALTRREERIEELEAHIADLKVQRDGLREDRDELRQEVQSLEGEIQDLEAEIDGLRDRLDDGAEGGRRLSQEEALAGTNLFVRYASKSGATLADAEAGQVDPEEVNGNLRLEHHTQFDADAVTVDGRSFDEFLEESIYVGYVRWLVRVLLYEIQDTGNEGSLADLYGAIPRVDRAELLGDVEVQYTEDGETYSEGRQFDVVLRDQMGDPLIVADVNDARNPATRDMMEGVIQNANDVKESNESLAAGMLVTASFFEPGALETAKEATAGGGLMGGSSKESFVKLSRKRGYHLLLVETRDDEFHVNVPEL